MSQPNWIKSAWGWASAIPHNFTAPASRGLPASRLTGTPPFPDVDSNHWASDYIQTLANLGIISGFPDGSFRPDAPVTRAQFAAILRNAFPADVDLRSVKPFNDVAPSYWATSAISTTRATGFLSGYPGNRFRPEQNIPRIQALVALASGLNYAENRFTTTPDRDLANYYQDADQIPAYAIPSLAAATDLSLVVNYPNLRQLNPNRNASRAEIAAFVYQALYQEAKAPLLPLNPYRVIATSQPWNPEPSVTLPVQAAQLSFNGPGTRLATLDAGTNLIKVWDLETGRSLTSINAGLQRQFAAMALSEDGEIGVAIVQSLSPSNPTYSLNAWSITTGQLLWEKPFEHLPSNSAATPTQLANSMVLGLSTRPRHNEILTQASFAFAPAEQLAQTQLRLHSLETGEVTQTLSPSPGAELFQFAFSFTGEYLAALGTVQVDDAQPTSGNQPSRPSSNQPLIDIWQLSDGSRLPGLSMSQPSRETPGLNYFTLAFTPNGSLRTLGQNLNDIQLDTWDIRDRQRINQTTQLPDIDRQDRLGRLSPDGVWYFVRSDVAGTRLINTQLPATLPLNAFGQQAVFSDKGDRLAIANNETVQIFTQATLRP